MLAWLSTENNSLSSSLFSPPAPYQMAGEMAAHGPPPLHAFMEAYAVGRLFSGAAEDTSSATLRPEISQYALSPRCASFPRKEGRYRPFKRYWRQAPRYGRKCRRRSLNFSSSRSLPLPFEFSAKDAWWARDIRESAMADFRFRDFILLFSRDAPICALFHG